mgnify:CR=1 FL=1
MNGPGRGLIHHQNVLILEYNLKLPKKQDFGSTFSEDGSRYHHLIKIRIRMDGPGGGFIHHQNVRILEYNLKLPKKQDFGSTL